MFRDIPLNELHPNPGQPRKHFEGIEELAASLRENGQVTTILVRRLPEGYQIIHGERRWRAAKLAGLESLRAEVRAVSDEEAYWLSLVENVGRKNLTPIEEAQGYESLLSAGLTQAVVGAMVGKRQSYVAHKMRLLKAPRPVRAFLAKAALSEGHARQLLRFKGLYPKGKKGWIDDYMQDIDSLAEAYNILRPEDQPIVPLWDLDREKIGACPHLQTLLDSLKDLEDVAALTAGWVAQPIIAAWWWGSAAIVYEISVAKLGNHINQWFQRFQSAVSYVRFRNEALEKLPSIWESWSEDRQIEWWLTMADLRHSNCLPITHEDWAQVWTNRQRPMPFGVVFPSSMQAWGFYNDVAKRLKEDWEQ